MIGSTRLGLILAGALVSSGVAAQGVDYHRAQQAGKVWGDKIGENNRRSRRDPRVKAPATAVELAAAKRRHRAGYDRLVSSVGTKNADKWLDFKARYDRAR